MAQDVINPALGFLNAEARRSLDNAVFVSNAVRSVQMPRDTVVKRLLMSLIGTHDVTYGSGAPLVSEFGFFSRLCPTVEVNVNGNRVVKAVDPYMARLAHILKMGSAPRRATSISAAAATVTRATREWVAGTLAYPSTTEFFLFNDCVPLSFEFDWGWDAGRYDTELDIRDVASCDLKFYFGTISNILQDGNAASVTYANSNIYVETQIIENRARPRPKAGDVLYDYVEYLIRKTYTGQARSQQIELQTGNYLAALGILCRNGDTNKSPAENLLTNMALKVNGATAIQGPVSQRALQDDNVARYGVEDPLGLSSYLATIASVAGAHPLKGYSMMNLVRSGNWNSSINTSRSSGVDTIKLEFDTPSTSGLDPATYTNALEVSVHTHEIRPFTYNS